MTRAEFNVLLVAASFEATRFGQRFVRQALPFVFHYRAHLNQSADWNAAEEDVLYRDDEGRVVDLGTEDEVVSLLWRDGRCPQWIDVNVVGIGPSFTLLQLLCCGRFTSVRERFYYQARGFGPFGIKSPNLPPDWTEGARFDIKNA